MIKAAGILFIQDSLFLAAYNPRSQIWSGIGGKIEQDETMMQAAFRETLEELFGLKPVKTIVDECVQLFSSNKTLTRANYAYIPVRFDQLKDITAILNAHAYTSPYYTTLPDNVRELVHLRQTPDYAEITSLKIVDYFNHDDDVSEELLEDYRYLYRYT
jgi:8-oxo-dGTP pyrophosphatase MutT (NUDIX family)